MTVPVSVSKGISTTARPNVKNVIILVYNVLEQMTINAWNVVGNKMNGISNRKMIFANAIKGTLIWAMKNVTAFLPTK